MIGNLSVKDNGEENERCTCDQIISRENGAEASKIIGHFVLKTHVKEVLNPAQIGKLLELDFNEAAKEEKSLSYLDRKFLNLLRSNTRHKEDGHYEVPLPLKDESLKLPNNKELAVTRVYKLKQRLQRDLKYREHYKEFMKELINKRQAEKVPPEELCVKDGRVWYIPHHGVYHPQKPEKIRVVFDASALFKGESLNRHLLQGPDLTNNLVGLLCRFRKEAVALMCDVESMFHQVYVKPEYRNFLRFLWWANDDLDEQPTEFRMKVHLFGAVSSSGCANFALKRTADDFEELYGREAAEFVRNDFYVDDGLKSVPSVIQAINLIKKTKELCAKGGFNLHKFLSNKRKVIESVPTEQRAKGIKDFDLSKDLLPIERALGV